MPKLIEPAYILPIDSNDQPKFEVRGYENLGFEIEIRFDLCDGAWRQIYTGAQESLNPKLISPTNGIYSMPDAELQLAADGSLHMRSKNIYFSTQIPAFSSHRAPIELYQEVNSLKLTDLEGATPAAYPPTTYQTCMRRFSYARPEGQILGLPGQTGELNRNGYRFELYNTDQFEHTPARPALYQSWPILMHQTQGGWCSIFFDNPSRTFVDVGEFYKDRITFEASYNNIRVFILLAETLPELSQKLVTLLGRPLCPPRWAFGYQQSRWSYMNSTEVRKVVNEFKQNQIPLHAMYFDIDYMDEFRVFTVNEERFPDLPQLTKELLEDGIHPLCIVDPGVKVDTEYAVYTKLKESGAYLKTDTEEDFVAEVWPGDTLLPDFNNPLAQKLWTEESLHWMKANGFVGMWNDMNEPSNFRGQNRSNRFACTERGSLELDHNLYGYYMAKVSADSMHKLQGENTLVISRAGYPGLQQFAVVWHGDNQCWWEHLRLALRTTIQYSLCGLFFTGADVPGFTGNPPDDLAVRFFQLGAFLPFFRGHSWKYSNDKEPYSFSDAANKAIKDAILLRESMLDEWYHEFKNASQTFCSPILPCLDSHQKLIDDQYLLFDRYLVAPVLDRDAYKRLLYLPDGRWKRFQFGDTHTLLRGNCWHVEDVSLTCIPIYQRA